MILLQSQPFGRRDPWAVVNHAAAASALRAVRTVFHQLIRLSASGSRPVKDLVGAVEARAASSGLGSVADVLPASNCRGSGTPHVGNCQTSVSSGIFEIQGCC